MSENYFQIRDGKLIIPNISIELPFLVLVAVGYRGQIIAIIEPPAGAIFNRKIFAFPAAGGLIWQIKECPHGTEIDKPFIGVFCNQDDLLVAGIGLVSTI